MSNINNNGTPPLHIAAGGTGANTTPIARLNLGLGSIATQDASGVSIKGGAITNIKITNSTVHANLISANAQITGGTITGIAPLSITSGGTSADNQSDALINLGAAAITRQVLAGTGLGGGGALSNDITLSIALNSNGYGNRTISSDMPSGGGHGDIWYQV
jgi:hypothetical protein